MTTLRSPMGAELRQRRRRLGLFGAAIAPLLVVACTNTETPTKPLEATVLTGGGGSDGTGGTTAATNGGKGTTAGGSTGSAGKNTATGGHPTDTGGHGGTTMGAAGKPTMGGAGMTAAAGAAGQPDMGSAGMGDAGMGAAGAPPDPCIGVSCSGHGTCSGGACTCDSGYVAAGTECQAVIPSDACDVATCPAGSTCEGGICYCDDPTQAPSAGCWTKTPGASATHSKADVCAAFQVGSQQTSGQPWTKGATDCDPGTLDPKSVFDTMNRAAAFRWFVGEAPAPFVLSNTENDELGAVLCAYNPPGTVPDPHMPPMTAKCYTPGGAGVCGSSDLAWGGSGPMASIDLWFEDNGNETTFGHRRWMMNPPLGPVDIGYAEGGPYGGCTSMGVFSASTAVAEMQPYYSWPPAGFVPAGYAMENWTLHGPTPTGSGPTMVVHGAKNPSKALTMTASGLVDGYGELHTTFFSRDGWDPEDGETYTVDVTDIDGGPISYQLTIIDCQ